MTNSRNPISLKNRISDAFKIFEKENLFFGFPLNDLDF